MGAGNFMGRITSGAKSGSIGGPWGMAGGALTGALYGGAEELGWGGNDTAATLLGLGGPQGGGDGGFMPDQSAFQLSPEQQAFADKLMSQSFDPRSSAGAAMMQQGGNRLQNQQASMAAGATSQNRALAQTQASRNVASGQADIANSSAMLASQEQARNQRMAMQMLQFQKGLDVAYEKLRSGQALNGEELANLQQQQQYGQMQDLMAAGASGLAQMGTSGGGSGGGDTGGGGGADPFGATSDGAMWS